MIEILKNPKTENYRLLKETILSRRFPWFYASTTTHGESEGIPGFVNVPMFGHVFIGRPETYGWSTTDSDMHQLAVDVVREILHENNFISKDEFKNFKDLWTRFKYMFQKKSQIVSNIK